MSLHVTEHRKGFGAGMTEITRFADPGEPTGLSFGVLKLAAGEEMKAMLNAETDSARTLGIFGSPTFTIGDELFWGDDRLEQARLFGERVLPHFHKK